LKPKSAQGAGYALDAVERHLHPDRLAKLNSSALATFQSRLRKTGVKESTVASVLRHVRAALGWAVSIGLLTEAPKIIMPKQAKGRRMKGRAITGEELDRLLDAVAKVRPHDAPAWRRYIQGVWLSGLRLAESIKLSWDDGAPFAVDLTGRYPRLRIRGTSQKSGNDELLPLAPDFAAFLLLTPPGQRHGPVFVLSAMHSGRPLSASVAGSIVAKIGETAGVVVDKAEGKFASLHDLRRSFATRWARRESSSVVRRLMRHASVTTTEAYYIDLDTDEISAGLWASHAPADNSTQGVDNTSSNSCPEWADDAERLNARSGCPDCT
jgi:integrase